MNKMPEDKTILDDVEKRIQEIDNKIDGIRDAMNTEIYKLQDERRKLEKLNKHFYVAKLVRGDCNYWDEYFYPLGEVTEAYAKQWIEDNAFEYEVCRDPDEYFEVTREEFYVLLYILRIEKAHEAISYSRVPMEREITELLCKSKKELAAKTTLIKYPSYQHVRDPEES